MTIEKTKTIDKIEAVGDYKHIQVRERTDIVEDGNVLSSTYHRWVIAPGQDYNNEHADVQAMCQQFHTQAIIDSYTTFLAEQQAEQLDGVQ
jgi:hypothetical protein